MGATIRPDWKGLYGLAGEQAGCFTAAQAGELGFSPQLLVYHVKERRLARARRGVYRLVHWPPSDLEGYVVIWLWSERRGTFSHETALFLHELSDALPARTHLTLPLGWKRRRFRVPPGVVLHYADLPEEDRAWFGCMRATSPARTVLDCAADRVQPELVAQAIEEGAARGLFSKDVVAPAIEYVSAFDLAGSP